MSVLCLAGAEALWDGGLGRQLAVRRERHEERLIAPDAFDAWIGKR